MATAVLFFVILGTTTWHILVVWLIAASIVTFAMYGLDKVLSKTGAFRIPESILHLMAIIGGAFGALIAMPLFRHKSNYRKHPLFIPIILISLVIQATVVYRFVLT